MIIACLGSVIDSAPHLPLGLEIFICNDEFSLRAAAASTGTRTIRIPILLALAVWHFTALARHKDYHVTAYRTVVVATSTVQYGTILQIMLCGGPGATPRSRDSFVNYPVSFSLRYLYIRPISRHVTSVCLSVTGRRSFVREFG